MKVSTVLNGIFYEVTLPEGLTIEQLEEAMKTVTDVFDVINDGLTKRGMPPLSRLIRVNQYSGMVSDLITRALDKLSDFKRTRNTEYPDLKNPRTNVGIEIKATTSKQPWTTVGHNVTSGWFLVFEYDISETGSPSFRRVWIGELTEEDFVWRGRRPTSKRTPTASVKKKSWELKMKKLFERAESDLSAGQFNTRSR
uniref:Uncharacterized protein n=1 Tax=Thermofilum adornatum TaxID=1365176 RepID=A0A7C1CD73_9CREN